MNTWWRAHNNSMHHRKLLKLSDEMHRAWYTLNCVASENGGTLPEVKDIALELRIKPEKVAMWVAKLVAAELYDNNDGVFSPHNWGKRQYLSDAKDPTAAKRAKDYRDRKRDASRRDARDVTSPPEQSRTDTEQNTAEKTLAAVVSYETKGEQSDIVVRVLKSDLMEAFGDRRCPDLSRASEWIAKGYAPSMCVDVVRELLVRKPDVSSLAYFDAAIAERHKNRPATPSERAAGASEKALEWAVGLFAKGGQWSRQLGPEPGQIGCKVSPEMLARHGLGTDGQKLKESA